MGMQLEFSEEFKKAFRGHGRSTLSQGWATARDMFPKYLGALVVIQKTDPGPDLRELKNVLEHALELVIMEVVSRNIEFKDMFEGGKDGEEV